MKKYVLHLVYFSPTGSTATTLGHIALGMESPALNRVERHNLTPQDARQKALTTPLHFGPEDVVLLGMPVYYGRIPSFFHKFTGFEGHGARIIPVVVYGNRDYDDALLELCDLAQASGFVTVGAGAFVAEHSLNHNIAAGRPDAHDKEQATLFGAGIAKKLAMCSAKELAQNPMTLPVKGNRPYKAYGSVPFVPGINADMCTACGACVRACPAGIIEGDTFTVVDRAACIACLACMAHCPAHARSLDAAMLPLFDKAMEQLAQKCTEHREAEYYL